MNIASAATALFSGLLLAITPVFGQTWTQTSANTNYEWGSIACSADGTKLVASAEVSGSEETFLSTDSGATWALSSGLTDAGSLVSSADGTKLAAISENIVFTSIDSGKTWTHNQPPSGWQGGLGGLAGRNGLEMSADGNTLIAVADSGGIYVSTNTGATWLLATNLDDQWVDCVCSANGTKLAALPFDFPLSAYLSTNSGVTWVQTPPFTGEGGLNWLVSVEDGSKLIMEGSQYSYLSTNWGQTWQSFNDDGYIGWEGSADLSLAMLADHNAGIIYTSTNIGMTWSINNAPQTAWNTAACSADGKKLFAAAGSNGSPSTNGIWTLQLPVAPKINFSSSTGAVNFSWLVPSTNMVLEESPDMNLWTALTNSPSLNLTNLQEQLRLLATNSSEFFRLVSQ